MMQFAVQLPNRFRSNVAYRPSGLWTLDDRVGLETASPPAIGKDSRYRTGMRQRLLLFLGALAICLCKTLRSRCRWYTWMNTAGRSTT